MCHKSLWFKILLQLFPLQDNPVIPTDNYPKWLKSHILARFSNSRPPSMYGHVTLSDFPFWALSYDWFLLLSSWESNDSPNIQDFFFFFFFYSLPLLIKGNKERNDNDCMYLESVDLTWNDRTPSSSLAGGSSLSVMSTHSRGLPILLREHNRTWLASTFCTFLWSCSKAMGIVIETGSASSPSIGQLMWRIGLTKTLFSSKSSFGTCCTWINN